MNNNNLTISVILPCRNEEQALAYCINQINEVFAKHKINGEIIVSDSSTDSSPDIANKLGVKLVKHDLVGYGRACLEGFKIAQGKYIFMADADGTYDFNEIPNFLKHLDQGYDLVIGNRLRGKIEKNAMPWLHQYFGNPALSFLLRLFFKSPVADAHSGMRAIKHSSLLLLNLRTTGMEFASEMIIRAAQEKLKIKELPINYHKRQGVSKLKPFSDGWRHLRFMLMFAPNYLFLIPGILLVTLGLLLIVLFINHVVYGCFLLIVGYQIFSLGIFSKTYMKSAGFIKQDKMVEFLARVIKFETGIFLGIVFLLFGLLVQLEFVFGFLQRSLSIPANSIILIALTLAIIGVQTMFFSFLISILLVEKNEDSNLS